MKYLLSIFVLLSINTALLAGEQKFLEKHEWPKTCDTAVDWLILNLSEKDKTVVRKTQYNKLIMLHHGWGTSIRNNFGLWQGNKPLMQSCVSATAHPDSVSSIIIEKSWLQLNLQYHCSNQKKANCNWYLKHQLKLIKQKEKQKSDFKIMLKKLKYLGFFKGSLEDEIPKNGLKAYIEYLKFIKAK